MDSGAKDKEKERWYPGKYLGRQSKRRSVEVARNPSDDSEPLRPNGAAVQMAPEIMDSADAVGFDNQYNPTQSGLDTVGSVRVQVTDIKYLRMTAAKVMIQLDRVSSQYAVDSSNRSFERSFDLHDIAADVRITVTGKGDSGDLVCGVTIIPVATLLTFVGKPAPAKEQWRLLYPISVSRTPDAKPLKFSCGYTDLPGYALNRAKDPLGFVCIKVDLTLSGSLFDTYLARGSTGWKRALASAPWIDTEGLVEITSPVRSNAELVAMIQRDLARVLAVFRLPLSLTSVFSLPEVLVVNLLIGCMCFVLDAWQLPLALVGFCALNGVIAMTQRSYAGVTVWNDPIPLTLVGTPADPNHSSNLPQNMDPLLFLAGNVPSSLTAYPAAAAAATALMQQQIGEGGSGEVSDAGSVVGGTSQRTSGGVAAGSMDGEGGVGSGAAAKDRASTALRLLQLQNLALSRVARSLAQVANLVEVTCNLLSFADPRASIIAYAGLSAAATAISFGLYLWPRMCTFTMVTTTATACAASAFLLDLVDAKSENKRSLGSERLSQLSDALDRLVAFLGRVPNELELVHRHIAGTAVMNPKGSEMQDAALAFEKRVAK